jgi:hypothetical protein
VLKDAGAPTNLDCNIQAPCLSQTITTGGNAVLSFDSTVLTLAIVQAAKKSCVLSDWRRFCMC